MTITVAFVIIAYIITIVVSAILYLLGIFKVKTPFFIIAVCVPFVGFAMLIIEARFERGYGSDRNLDVDKLKVNDIRYEKVNMPENKDDKLTVPLEEAIAIDDRKTRRKLILSILSKDPSFSVNTLESASLSEDTEMSHYATTAMTSIQGEYENDIADTEKSLAANPEDADMFLHYRDILKRYIDSGLISGTIRTIYLNKLNICLQSLMALLPEEKQYWFEYTDSCLTLLSKSGDDKNATSWIGMENDIKKLIERFPDDVTPYQIYMKYARLKNDEELTHRILRMIKERGIYLDSKERQWYTFWGGQIDEDNS